eukprot:CAMPEP_0170485858 /NCGR_PEP_ID=MMETSP0208-20121228/5019_1 /TAXON_ID=197538 /ORGANISM="Strombidium inclinatum, Strain S3" /LENGTH=66 /DNA_ID=CAMNT_0010759631 /DNA_START=1414 /DNA_END=1614 /DNA_ORIENTATION=+
MVEGLPSKVKAPSCPVLHFDADTYYFEEKYKSMKINKEVYEYLESESDEGETDIDEEVDNLSEKSM